MLLALLLGALGFLTACHKKKAKAITDEETAVVRPAVVERISPEVGTGFTLTPTFRVGSNLEPGFTVRLFTDANCTNQVGSGVVPEDATSVTITTNSLESLHSYQIYANATDPESGETSRCSHAYARYKIVACPDGLYAPVDGNADLGTDAFCVMRTEAKDNGEGIPVSTYENLPWNNISAIDAKAACKSIVLDGGSCDLISNPQWMTIARSIELNPVNWSNGVVGSVYLSRGHYMSHPAEPLSISDPTDYWDQEENPNGYPLGWFRRAFTLSNSEVVWDFAGNVREWVDWETGGDTYTPGPSTCPYGPMNMLDVDCAALAPNDYLPANPMGLTVENYYYHYFGKVYGTSEENQNNGGGGGVLRGGAYGLTDAGIYYLYLERRPSQVSTIDGFRCVCTLGL